MSQLSLFGPSAEPSAATFDRDDNLVGSDIDREDWCFVIGCGCVTSGVEIEGHLVCGLHDTAETREVVATGAWPAWYGYEGKWRVVPTVRRLDDMGHSWSGKIFREKKCSTCQITYEAWSANRFGQACSEYQQPDLTKGLFRQ